MKSYLLRNLLIALALVLTQLSSGVPVNNTSETDSVIWETKLAKGSSNDSKDSDDRERSFRQVNWNS